MGAKYQLASSQWYSEAFGYPRPCPQNARGIWKLFLSDSMSSVFRPPFGGGILEATISGHFGFVKTRAGRSRDYGDVIIFEKRRFKTFSIITEAKSRVFKFLWF